jgi:ascorbate-specific PTS system EIIC-type component UlaA
MLGVFGAFWGITGVLLLLGSAVYRLTPIAVEAMEKGLAPLQWASLILVVLFMAYAEGYRGFQQRFSPRVAARARYLMEHPRALHVALAPFFCMGYFHATRRRKVTSISVTAGIVVLIILVRLLHQPWRGIIDMGVLVGLIWGIASIAVYSLQAFTQREFGYSPETPETSGRQGK